MKKTTNLLIMVTVLLFSVVAMAQSTVSGTVIDADLNAPLPGANIIEVGTTNGVSTDFDGNFKLNTSKTSGEIKISYVGYATLTVSFSGSSNLGTIALKPDNSLEEIVIVGTGVIDLAEDRKTPVAVSTIRRSDIQARGIGNVEVTEIMKSTPSVFVSPGGGGFGDGALFVRGFDDTNTAILLNGQPVNSQEDGRVFWSNWQGVADVANAVQIQRGLGASKLAISSVGGTVNIVMKAADKNEGGFVRFLSGNDSYVKTTAEYNSGINDKGWAFSIMLDHWQAHRSWAEGTFGQGQNYFVSVGYKPNDKHNFNFLFTGAPQLHGQRWSQSEDRIANDPKYNQHWGYTGTAVNGMYTTDIESERTNFYHKPVANLNWDWTINENSNLSTVLYGSWGRGGGTGPRGDGRIRTDDRQIDYFAIEQNNQAIGIATGGDDGPGYIRRASMNNHNWYGLVSNFNHDFNEKLSFNVGTDIRFYRGDHFRQVVDLYGLQGWGDDRPDGRVITNTYEANPWAATFNFAGEEDRIDYDYSENINYQGLFTQIEYAAGNFSAFVQGAVSNQSFQREERFNTPGKSEKLSFDGYNIKGGASFTINNSNKLFLNTGYYSRQPFLDNIFANVRRSNELVVPTLQNEDITGFEAGYEFKIGNNFTGAFNFYHTLWENRVLVAGSGENDNGTPNDTSDDFEVNTFQRGINQKHIGAEFDFLYKVASWLRINGFFSAGSYKFEGESSFDEFNADSGELINSGSGINRDGVSVPGIAQTTAGLSAVANITNALSIDGNMNFYGNNYRNDGDALHSENIGTIDDFALVDFGLSYTFPFGDDAIVLRGNVFNALDNIVVSNSDRFGFFNTDGRTFNVSLRYNF